MLKVFAQPKSKGGAKKATKSNKKAAKEQKARNPQATNNTGKNKRKATNK